MTWEKFWSIIDRVRAKADMQDEASVKQFLYTELIKLPQDELLSFDCAWQSYRNKANFPKMVAAACIINDGSSDDRFTDFRNWLIMQGYDAYRQALIDPDNLAALNIPFRDTEWMGCGNVAWYAYAGQKLHTYFEKAGITAPKVSNPAEIVCRFTSGNHAGAACAVSCAGNRMGTTNAANGCQALHRYQWAGVQLQRILYSKYAG